MAKKIVLLSDGTGNASSSFWRTNVWRVFESLDLRSSDQVAFYDDGVGTSAFRPLAIVGGAFGYGLKRNVLELYKFLCRNYGSNQDEIFAFGFSRGAFTIRVLTGLVVNQGLVTYENEAELERKARAAYRAYRAEKFNTKTGIDKLFRTIRNWFVSATHDKNERPVDSIRFLGLWDTVAAYGLPIEEMTRGVSRYLFPLELPDRQLHCKVIRACHALALDDERTTFHPVLWDESKVPTITPDQNGLRCVSRERLSQVWFAGVHSNVGGGYPDDSLAHVPLNWILTEAKECGLKFKESPPADPDALAHARSAQDKDGKLGDSRSGLGGYYRYGPRKLSDLCDMVFSKDPNDKVKIEIPKIHESVLDRAKNRAHLYAPIVLPEKYELVTYDGQILSPTQNSYEKPEQAAVRATDQESILNIVWRRRGIYFLTVFASLYLATYPLYHKTSKTAEFETPLRHVADAIRLLGSFLPNAADLWLNTYAREPAWFLLTALIIVVLIATGSRLGATISDRMNSIWGASLGIINNLPQAKRGWLRTIVTSVFVLVALCVIFHPWLPQIPYIRMPDLLKELDGGIAYYRQFPVWGILAFFLIVILLPAKWIFSLRNATAYKNTLRTIKLGIAPAVFAVLFVYLFIMFGNHLMFSLEDAWGFVCKEHPKRQQQELRFCSAPTIAMCGKDRQPACQNPRVTATCQDGSPICDKNNVAMCGNIPAVCPKPCTDDVVTIRFNTSDVCFATGLKVERWGTYRLTVTPEQDRWYGFNGLVGTNAGGFRITELTNPFKKAVMLLLWPLKRTFIRPWFAVIARVGATGNDEEFLDPDDNTSSRRVVLDERFKPRRDGELFLYVNDAAVFSRWLRRLSPWFYEWNQGTAVVRIERVPN